jgi:hypothetical protein
VRGFDIAWCLVGNKNKKIFVIFIFEVIDLLIELVELGDVTHVEANAN